MNDNPMIADVKDSTTLTSGLWIIEDVEGLIQAIDSGSWVDGTIGAISTGLDGLSVAMDPLGALASLAVGWLIEHVEPLSDALEKVTGSADEVNSYAATWGNVASGLSEAATNLQTAVKEDIPSWKGEAANSYHTSIDFNIQGIGGVAAAAEGMRAATEGAGMLVATVREIVRDLIADCVSTLLVRVPEWLAEEGLTLGLATPWVVSQAASLIAKWVGRIIAFLQALITSIQSLSKLVD